MHKLVHENRNLIFDDNKYRKIEVRKEIEKIDKKRRTK